MSASWPALLPVLPGLGLLRWFGLGGQHLHSHAHPTGLVNEDTRAQVGLGEEISVISFSKTLKCGEVNVHSVDLPCSDVGRQVMIIHLGEVVYSGSCRVPGMGLLPSSRVFFPSAVVKG